ncbi:hypothetical protein NE237_005053 [Protea cynaroides]|uniref:Core Histone H2A/H2B/H3 domain-containing protein n=1 Tax=Protea cynaroides TaxID=273540 RepID=A0A9Q0QU94_9MAGN|nr:hypothetical protein NE237_005053 [Protea cynaroides]
MKADEDVLMISAEAPIIFAKACELFSLELTIRSWLHTEEIKHRTLQKNEIAATITRTDIFDFLVDIVPRDEIKDEAALLRRPLRTPFDTSYGNDASVPYNSCSQNRFSYLNSFPEGGAGETKST